MGNAVEGQIHSTAFIQSKISSNQKLFKLVLNDTSIGHFLSDLNKDRF